MTSWNFGRLIAAFAVTLIGCGFCFAGDGSAAEYVEGTIDAVPAHTAGALDLESREVLVLKFGDWRNTIPYEQITGAQWGRPHDGGWKEHITAPLSRLLSKPKYLTLEFRGGAGQQTERAVFRMAPKVAASLSPVLSARTAGTPERNGALADKLEERGWWGDRYWKTARNRHRWASKSRSADQNRPE